MTEIQDGPNTAGGCRSPTPCKHADHLGTILEPSNQSIKQSIHQFFDPRKTGKLASFNLSLNQSVCQPINQSINQSTNQSINDSTNQSINDSINQSINQSITHSLTQSTNQPINQ